MVYILGAVACVSMSFICKFYCHRSEHVFCVYMYVICILFLKQLKCWDIVSHVILFYMDSCVRIQSPSYMRKLSLMFFQLYSCMIGFYWTHNILDDIMLQWLILCHGFYLCVWKIEYSLSTMPTTWLPTLPLLASPSFQWIFFKIICNMQSLLPYKCFISATGNSIMNV